MDSDAQRCDPALAALGLLKAAVVLAVLDAAPDAVHLRRRTELRDENGREVGHEVLSVEVRDGRPEPSARATRIETRCPWLLCRLFGGGTGRPGTSFQY